MAARGGNRKPHRKLAPEAGGSVAGQRQSAGTGGLVPEVTGRTGGGDLGGWYRGLGRTGRQAGGGGKGGRERAFTGLHARRVQSRMKLLPRSLCCGGCAGEGEGASRAPSSAWIPTTPAQHADLRGECVTPGDRERERDVYNHPRITCQSTVDHLICISNSCCVIQQPQEHRLRTYEGESSRDAESP